MVPWYVIFVIDAYNEENYTSFGLYISTISNKTTNLAPESTSNLQSYLCFWPYAELLFLPKNIRKELAWYVWIAAAVECGSWDPRDARALLTPSSLLQFCMAMIVMFVFGLAQFIVVQIGYGYCDDEDSAFPNDICRLSATKKAVLYYLPSGILLCANVSEERVEELVNRSRRKDHFRARNAHLYDVWVQFWAFFGSCCLKEKLSDDDHKDTSELGNYYV